MLQTSILCGDAALLLTLPAKAADGKGEIPNAEMHAGLAAGAGSIDGVHMHLHHALNCLVGPSGDGFDTTNANPCAKAGAGILPDTTDAATKTKLGAAVASAKSGIAATDLATAQKDAQETADTIGAAK